MSGCRSASSTRTTSWPTSSRRSTPPKGLSWTSELAPHPNPLPASGERERAGAKSLAPFMGRGRGLAQGWEGEGLTVDSAQSGHEARLETAWPIDLRLTVASHGWVHLEPWRWEAESGTLSRAERIAGRLGTIALRQRDPTALILCWKGFPRRAEPQILT